MRENKERGPRDNTSLWQVSVYYVAEENIGRAGKKEFQSVAKDNLTQQEAFDEANRLQQLYNANNL